MDKLPKTKIPMVREYKAPNNDYWQPEDKSGEYVVIYFIGTKHWYKDGELHREGYPAVEGFNGFKEWWLNGKRHRVDGPAYVRKDGVEEYWFEGIKMADSAIATVKCYSKNKEDIISDFKNNKIVNEQTLKYRFFL